MGCKKRDVRTFMSRSKRFQSPRISSTMYNPKYSFIRKSAVGASFGTASRFKKPVTSYERRKTYSAGRKMKSKVNNDINKYNERMSKYQKFNCRKIREFAIDSRNYSPLRRKTVSGGKFGCSQRFEKQNMHQPGPGEYGRLHSINHSRLPYSLHLRSSK